MQIIIPMSGFGERFRSAGYSLPKPLIEVEGKPIIAHIIDLFPGEKDFLFICNQDHLDHDTYRMRDVLKLHCPSGRIIGIEPHKLGPVHAVLAAKNFIDPCRPAVVNYCDFNCLWDWDHFKNFVASNECRGAIPAYKGFHPHSLGPTNYAYLREESGWVTDIREKQPFTDNRMEEFASSGTYYFRLASEMLQAFTESIEQHRHIGGEYYVSLAYRSLLDRHEPVAIYPVTHFMQWGTPEDLAEFNSWSATFKSMIRAIPSNHMKPEGSIVMPMAGLGQRYREEGTELPKPLIPVSGSPMVVQAMKDLPASKMQTFVLRREMDHSQKIVSELQSLYPEAVIEIIDGVTEGQAITALIGLNALEKRYGSTADPVTFGACDNGVLFDYGKLHALQQDTGIDVIVWGARGHVNALRKPEMFGWIDTAPDGSIKSISVKEPLRSPATDPIIIGTFTFRRSVDFRNCVADLVGRNDRVNNEFYLDAVVNSAIALGFKCHLFEVESFISWGTPNDLRTFNYWQTCFDRWGAHSYSRALDPKFVADKV